jgi:hypothetical protein
MRPCLKKKKRKRKKQLGKVTHAYNPSYSGLGDREDLDSKPHFNQ